MTSLAAAQLLFRLEPVIPISAMSAPAQLIQLVRALGNVVSFARFNDKHPISPTAQPCPRRAGDRCPPRRPACQKPLAHTSTRFPAQRRPPNSTAQSHPRPSGGELRNRRPVFRCPLIFVHLVERPAEPERAPKRFSIQRPTATPVAVPGWKSHTFCLHYGSGSNVMGFRGAS